MAGLNSGGGRQNRIYPLVRADRRHFYQSLEALQSAGNRVLSTDRELPLEIMTMTVWWTLFVQFERAQHALQRILGGCKFKDVTAEGGLTVHESIFVERHSPISTVTEPDLLVATTVVSICYSKRRPWQIF